jgi:hypothetical protein
MVDVTDEKWNGAKKTLSGKSQIVGKDNYQLRIAGLNEPGKHWKLVSGAVSAADQNAGVRISVRPTATGEEDWARMAIFSEDSRSVEWSLRFSSEAAVPH